MRTTTAPYHSFPRHSDSSHALDTSKATDQAANALREADRQMANVIGAVTAREGELDQHALDWVCESLDLIAQLQPDEPDLVRRLMGPCVQDQIGNMDPNALEALDANLASHLKSASHAGWLQLLDHPERTQDLVFFQLHFSIRAQLLRQQLTLVQKHMPEFGQDHPNVTRACDQEELLKLRTAAAHLLDLAQRYPVTTDALPGTDFSLDDLSRVELGALFACQAQVSADKSDARMENAKVRAERENLRAQRDQKNPLRDADVQLRNLTNALSAEHADATGSALNRTCQKLELIALRHPHAPDLIRRLCGQCLGDRLVGMDRKMLETMEKGLSSMAKAYSIGDWVKLLDRPQLPRNLVLFQLMFSVKAELVHRKAVAAKAQMEDFEEEEEEEEEDLTPDWAEAKFVDLKDAAVHLVVLAETYPPNGHRLPGAPFSLHELKRLERSAIVACNALEESWKRSLNLDKDPDLRALQLEKERELRAMPPEARADFRAIQLVEVAARSSIKAMSTVQLKALREAVDRLKNMKGKGGFDRDELDKVSSHLQDVEEAITTSFMGPVSLFDARKLTRETLHALLDRTSQLEYMPKALLKAQKAMRTERQSRARAEFPAALQAALRETYPVRTADTLLRSAVIALHAVGGSSRGSSRSGMKELAGWIDAAVRAEKEQRGQEGLRTLQRSIAHGEGKLIRDLPSDDPASKLAFTHRYLDMLQQALSVSLPADPVSSARAAPANITALSVDAHAALVKHLGVDAIPDPLKSDDVDTAVANAETALELALRTGVVDAEHARKLIVHMHLVLAVPQNDMALQALKKLSAEVIEVVGDQDADIARDARDAAARVQAAIASG